MRRSPGAIPPARQRKLVLPARHAADGHVAWSSPVWCDRRTPTHQEPTQARRYHGPSDAERKEALHAGVPGEAPRASGFALLVSDLTKADLAVVASGARLRQYAPAVLPVYRTRGCATTSRPAQPRGVCNDEGSLVRLTGGGCGPHVVSVDGADSATFPWDATAARSVPDTIQWRRTGGSVLVAVIHREPRRVHIYECSPVSCEPHSTTWRSEPEGRRN